MAIKSKKNHQILLTSNPFCGLNSVMEKNTVLFGKISKFRKFGRTGAYNRRLNKSKQSVHPNNKKLGFNMVQLPSSSRQDNTRQISTKEIDNQIIDEVNFEFIDYEDSDNSENNDNIVESNVQLLRQWALNFNIPHTALKALLGVLHKMNIENIPNDPRILLETPRKITIEPMGNGQYWHGGLGNAMTEIFKLNQHFPDEVLLNFNIDGLPIHNSSKKQIWPILFSVENMDIPPKSIGIFYGETKPPSATEFLEKFTVELLSILQNGIIIGSRKISVRIRCFICDTPARSQSYTQP